MHLWREHVHRCFVISQILWCEALPGLSWQRRLLRLHLLPHGMEVLGLDKRLGRRGPKPNVCSISAMRPYVNAANELRTKCIALCELGAESARTRSGC